MAGLSVVAPVTAQAADKDDRTTLPEEDDFNGSPFTEYGEFNEEADEAADTRFYQYGRLFGVGVGLGMNGATGNRGTLWQGGFPLLDFKVHYWFNFNLALDIGVFKVDHNWNVPKYGPNRVSMVWLGADLKYYFDTKNLSAAISFANPYLVIGAGQYNIATTDKDANVDKDSAFAINAGAGLEFAIKPRKTYFSVEGKIHIPKFKDYDTENFQDETAGKLANMNGLFYTITGSFMFTW